MCEITLRFRNLQNVFKFSLKFNESISVKYRLRKNETILSFTAHGFFNYTASKTDTDLHDTERGKHQRKDFQ